MTNKLNLVPRKAKVDEIQSISKKPKEGQEPKHFDDEELNRLVPFADIFPDKASMLEELEKEFPGTELPKEVKFILDDIMIMLVSRIQFP